MEDRGALEGMQRLHSCYLKSKNPDRGTQLCAVELNRAATKGQKIPDSADSGCPDRADWGRGQLSHTLTGWVPTGFVVTHFLHQNPDTFDITYLCSKK